MVIHVKPIVKIDKTKSIKNELKARKRQLNSSIDALEIELNNLKTEKDKLNSEIHSLNSKLKENSTKNNELNENISTLNDAKEHMLNELKNAGFKDKDSFLEFETKVLDIKNQNNVLLKKNKELINKSNSLNKKVTDKKNTITGLNTDIQDLCEEKNS